MMPGVFNVIGRHISIRNAGKLLPGLPLATNFYGIFVIHKEVSFS